MRVALSTALALTLLLTRPAGEGADLPAPHDEREYFASPHGRREAAGTIDDPLDLATALARRGPVRPGDTIWLLSGTYTGSFTSTIEGTPAQPIVVRGRSPLETTFDARGSQSSSLVIRGAWTIFRDFEVMNSDPRRAVNEAGSRAADNVRRDGVVVYGAHTRLVNLIVHDNGDGIALWGPARGAEVYGCIVFDNGWSGPDRGHGHGLYIQSAEDTKRVRDVVSFNNFATGMKAYAERGRVDSVEFDGVISFNNGAPAAGDAPDRMPNIFVGPTSAAAGHVSVTNSYLFHPPAAVTDLGGNLALGFTASGNETAIVRGSHVVGGNRAVFLRDWRAVTVEGNTFGAAADTTDREHSRLAGIDSLDASDAGGGIEWDANRYLVIDSGAPGNVPQLFATDGRRRDFAGWREYTGFDGSSEYSTTLPAAPEVFVRPNQYERGRAHVVVFNWPRADTVDVDLSAAGLRPGEPFEVRDVQDLRGAPLVSGRFDGTAIRVTMTGLRAAPLIGGKAVAHTGPWFAAFVVSTTTARVDDTTGAR